MIDRNNSNVIVTIKDLSLGFGKKPVLDKLSVGFQRGETVLITGNNGGGKSTLLRCIAGVYLPDTGTVEFAEGMGKEKIGLISDKMSLFESFTLQQAIDFHRDVFNIKNFDGSLIEPLNIGMDQKIKNLSNGERALFHLTLLLSQEPELLLVDEIIHVIDPYLREIFLEAVIDLIDRLGTTVIMVNHTFSEMGRIPERVLIMENGKLIVDEKQEDLVQKMKKIITADPLDTGSKLPLVFEKRSSVYNEYYIYPVGESMKPPAGHQFREVALTEIVKSFIGGYYVKKRI